MNTLHIQSGAEGDIILQWDPENEDQVNKARLEFAKKKSQGYQAYILTQEHEEFDRELGKVVLVKKSGELTQDFDKEAKKTVMTPRMGGG